MTVENKSLELAKWIKEIPIIYHPNGLEAAAYRFKNSLLLFFYVYSTMSNEREILRENIWLIFQWV